MRLTRSMTLAAAVCAGVVASPLGPVAAAAPAPTTLTGSLPNGTTWQAEVPEDWDGTTVLFAHGFRMGADNPAWDNGFAPTAEALVDRGTAVVASSYATTGWALGTAAQDQIDALEAFEAQAGDSDRVIAMGRSMGGLVTSLIAERPDAGVDAAVSTCGLVGGGVALNNYQLDAAHAAVRLLAPDADVPLVGFTSPEEAQATVETITKALDEAARSPQGRARVALVAALLNTPTELPGVDQSDPVELAAAQAELVRTTLPEVIQRRSAIVNAAGGDSGWTAGVDYGQLLRRSAQHGQVQALYRRAGLNLNADLRRLTGTADVEPDEDGLSWMSATSVPTGDLQVPLLATHTLVDVLAPVEYQEEYAETIRQAGRSPLLRQAYVDAVGHCAFTVAENLAAIDAVEHRLDTGRWGTAATAESLDAAAEEHGEGRYVRFRLAEFVNDRTWGVEK
ncbi:alpha/beta hydrolase family protein [Nocardioides albus]|uniref:Pimeloyl-ACP methyl ester carboxylesterase n=1 Tax=Nocardioides albus TaxID=1841 RepID=A0A7W5F9U1_9ACTN|nr:alpha/beta hydrolase [Nocardioides albus]MBB3090563.1 pimeloyl-ACP methyl ester carboxylesterase [Nocardioides albus]GGU24772.1 alpha/beta hydrolase [Nocardioides albus]